MWFLSSLKFKLPNYLKTKPLILQMPMSPYKPLKMGPNLIPEAEILTTFKGMINKQEPIFRAEIDGEMKRKLGKRLIKNQKKQTLLISSIV